MRVRHLELQKSGEDFSIKINSLVGRLSLLADHPHYKLKEAMNPESRVHRTGSELSLVPMSTKDMYVLEDRDSRGNKIQNFVYVSEELSKTMRIQPRGEWVLDHAIDFVTRSISVIYLALYLIYFFFYMRYFNTLQTLYVLRYITGVITLAFAVTYYYLRSSRTKSSFLKFCLKTELFLFIVSGTINNLYAINYTPDAFFNNATDIF